MPVSESAAAVVPLPVSANVANAAPVSATGAPILTGVAPPVDPHATAEWVPQKEGKSSEQLRKIYSAERMDRARKAFADSQGEVAPDAATAVIEAVDGAVTDPALAGDVQAEIVAEKPISSDVVEDDTPDPGGGGEGVQTPEQSRLERAKAAAAKAKDAARRYRTLQAERDRISREHEMTRARVAQLEQQAQRGDALEQSLRGDPLKALQQLGVTPDKLVERALQDGTPAAEIAALRELVAQERHEREQLQQTIKQREYAEQAKHAESAFVAAAKNAERYPNIAHMAPEILVMLGKQVAQEARARYIRETGTAPTITDRQILSYLNQKLATTEKPSAAATPKKAAPTPKPKAPATAGPKATPESPRTLTNVAAGQVSKPSNWEQLSRNQRMAHLRDSIRKR